MICNDCNKEFKHKNKRKEYCSKKCKDKSSYLRNKEKHLILVKKWQKNNPKKTKEYNKKSFKKFYINKRERFNELMRNAYKKYNRVWKSRKQTRKFVYVKGRHLNFELSNSFFRCKKCKKKENLEIHHEIYPIEKEAIKEAIDVGKIYFLCKYHHYKKEKRKLSVLTRK